jgi:hypothetical protein
VEDGGEKTRVKKIRNLIFFVGHSFSCAEQNFVASGFMPDGEMLKVTL